MKNSQRFLALLTSIGLAATMSSCHSNRQGGYLPVENGAYESTICMGDQGKINEIVKKINDGGKYSVRVSGTGLYIRELGADLEPDYDLFAKLIETGSIDFISIGYANYNLSLPKLINGKEGIQAHFYEVVPLSSDKVASLCADISTMNTNTTFVSTGIDPIETIIKIADSLGSINGSLDLRSGSSYMDFDKLFDSINSASHFYTVSLYSGTNNFSTATSKINADVLNICADLTATSDFEISPSVKELTILDDYNPSAQESGRHDIEIRVPNGLIRSTIEVDRPVVVTLSDPSIEQVISVPTKAIAEMYIDKGLSSLSDATLNIKEDYSSILVSDYIYYYQSTSDNVLLFSKDNFSSSSLYGYSNDENNFAKTM